MLEQLGGRAERSAAFVCVLVLALPAGGEIVAEGRCEGAIARQPRGENGFGYDPIFYREDLGGTFGEVSQAEKNALSHRGTAARALIEALEARGLLKRRLHG